MCFTGRLYRIVFARDADRVLDGAIHPEGRFHHDGQAALYASPSPEAAAIAVANYIKPGDADRVMVRINVENADLADLRLSQTRARLGIDENWASVPWVDQRKAGLPATSWRASDAVRQAGADGMIYRSRKSPDRWHVVFFRWNRSDRTRLSLDGPPKPWTPMASKRETIGNPLK